MIFQTVFNLCMDLMDERSSNGTISATDTADYTAKAPGLFTVIQTELCQAEGLTAVPVTALSETVLVSNEAAMLVMPYGLAAHLLLSDGNTTMAGFYQQRYDELKRKIGRTAFVSVTDVYDITRGMT